MIAYSTNMMGPWGTEWYEDRNLVDSDGNIITYYAGGRIDIRGLSETDFHNGWHEYSLPIMHAEDFNNFSEWLDEHYTDELMSYGDIMELFEEETNTKIRWFE